MKTEPILVQCSTCEGVGVVEMNGAFADTLVVLRRQKTELTGVELAKLMKVNPTAMNNRLVWLESHGLAVGRKYGPARFWRAIK